MNSYDIIVIGLGAMGSATLYQLAKRGLRVLGIDRFDPPHTMGSSHAETRITRLAVGEGPQYVPLVARSHQIWHDLEAQTGRQLLFRSGGYIIEPRRSIEPGHWQNFVESTATVAADCGIEYQLKTPAEVRRDHPQLKIGDADRIGYEPSGGVVLSERAVEIQLALARGLGAATKTNEPVTDIKFGTDGVTVETVLGRYAAGRVVVTAGAWISDFVPQPQQNIFAVTRQLVFWFRPEQPALYSTDHYPFLIWAGETAGEYFSSFPMPPGGVPGVKCLTEQFAITSSAADVSRTVTPDEVDHFYHHFIHPKLNGVTPECVKAAVCLYTNTPDDHFVIDFHPDSERVVIVSPCSGHGFKHSAAIGESVAQLVVDGRSEIDLSAFKF